MSVASYFLSRQVSIASPFHQQLVSVASPFFGRVIRITQRNSLDLLNIFRPVSHFLRSVQIDLYKDPENKGGCLEESGHERRLGDVRVGFAEIACLANT